MKETRRVLTVLLLTATLATASFTGCTTGHGRWDPTTQTYSTEQAGDPIVVNAQKVRATALNVFATYFKIERENRAKLWKVNHEFKHVADNLRTNGRAYIDALTASIAEYQKLRSAENKLSIDNAITLVTSMTSKAAALAAKAKAVK